MAVVYIENTKDNIEGIQNLISTIKNSESRISFFDTETTGLDPFSSKLLLAQIKIGDDIFVINARKIDVSIISNIIKLMNDLNYLFVGHNIKFDYKVVKANTGLGLEKIYDTMIAESILCCGVGKKLYSLQELVEKYCGESMSKDERKTFFDSENVEFSQNQIDYAAKDVHYLETIYHKQVEASIENKLDTIFDIEMRVLPVVIMMEFTGISLDVEHWNKLTKEATDKRDFHAGHIVDLILERVDTSKYENAYQFAKSLAIPVSRKRDIVALEGITNPDEAMSWIRENFNQGSHNQLKTALNLIGISTDSTNEKVLVKLDKDPVIDEILLFREFEKQVSTYGDNVIKLINPVTNKIHTEYFSLGTVTGRFSSTDPNMQNLPRSGGYREGFISRPGYSFISMDYSQQEYRLVGALSREPKIINAYKDGYDMHTATAAQRFKKDLNDVTSEERSYGKTMNFAIIYGTTEYGLKRNFSIDIDEARKMLDDFYEGYPELTKFIKLAHKTILERGYSITPMGRKRYFKPLPTFATPMEIERKVAQIKREGFNTIIQGGGADVTKMAMIRMGVDGNKLFGDGFLPLLQVHDEVVAEVRDDLIDDVASFMEDCMVGEFQPFLGDIPAKVDYKVAKRWGK